MRATIPFLWFDGNAREAVEFYCSIFPDSEITRICHKPDEPGAGSVLTIEFKLRERNSSPSTAARNSSFPKRFR